MIATRFEKRSKLTVLRMLFLYTLALLSVLPVAWVFASAFRSGLTGSIRHPTVSNFQQLFSQQPFGRWLINSVFLASTQTVVSVVLASLGGFAVSKYRFAGRRSMLVMLLSVMLLPYQVLLPSSYELMHQFNWLDSYWAILAPGATSVFGLFLFSRAMQQVPDELLHAARMDGCSEFRLWWEIAIPLVKPMIAAFTLLSFLAAWNNFLWPQVVLQDEGKYTLPIGLANMSALPASQNDYGILMAGTLVCIFPVVMLFFALQKDFIAGLTSGALRE